VTVIDNGLHFIFRFPLHEVGWRSRVVYALLFRLLVWSKKGSVEHVMDGPGHGKSEFVSDGGDLLSDLEGSMMSGV
jgi:hypothetical protein